MSNQIQKLSNRTLAIILAIVMIVGMLPTSAFATGEGSSSVTATLPQTVQAGEFVEFDVTTVAGSNENTPVLGYLTLSSWGGVELQYKENDGGWYPLPQGVPFGPAGGFPLGDKTSHFRVKFANSGSYSFRIEIRAVEGSAVLCHESKNITVVRNSEIETNIHEKVFEIGVPTEFTFRSIPNGHAGRWVYGKFTFSNWDAVETLEYWGVGENAWLPLPKDVLFGPAETGFPMTDATTRLRVTFNKSGNYSCTVALVDAKEKDIVLSSVTKSVTVAKETVLPVLGELSATTGWAQSATVSGTATDEGGSGLSKVVYSTEKDYAETHAAAALDNGSFSFTVAANATYYVWAVDGDGNVSEAKSVVIANVDTVAPTVKAPEATEWTNTAVTIQVETTDAHSGVAKVMYRFNAEEQEATLNEDGTYSFIAEQNGNYNVWAIDKAGNKSTEAVILVRIDKDAPTAFGAVADEKWTNEKTVTIQGSVSDVGGSEVVKVVYSSQKEYAENKETHREVTPVEGAFSFEVQNNGTYYVWAIDKAGNVSAEAAEIVVKNIDRLDPEVTAAADPAAWTNSKVVVSGTAKDQVTLVGTSKVAKVSYRPDGSEDVRAAVLNEDGTYAFEVDAEFVGEYIVWAEDNAGNLSKPVRVEIKIEREAPEVTAAADSSWTKDAVTVSGNATDLGGSELSHIAYAYGEKTGTADVNEDGEYSFDIDIAFEGKCYVWAVDNAGNESEKAEVEIQIERIAPEVTAEANPDAWTNGSVTISGTATDEGGSGITKEIFYNTTGIYTDAKTSVELDGDSFSFEITEEQNKTYYIWAVDNAGNVSNPATVQVQIDKTNPTATIYLNDYSWAALFDAITFGIYTAEDFKVSIIPADEDSDVQRVEYIIAQEPMTQEELETSELWKEYTNEITITTPQKLIVYAHVLDNAGNEAYFNTDGAILDDSVPQITLTAEDGFEKVYNGDVKVSIEVIDGEVYSGIKSIKYWVITDGKTTQEETLYNFGYDSTMYQANGVSTESWTISGSDVASENGKYTKVPTEDMLKNSWTGEIVVDAAANNDCDVKVCVQVTDNAGKTFTEEAELDIDITDPVVEVAYSDEGNLHNEKYFDGNRTATITVQEIGHHFEVPAVYYNDDVVPEDANNYIKITAKNADGAYVDAKPSIEWTPAVNDECHELTKYEAVIKYTVDANYTFEMMITDEAGNSNSGITTTGDAPFEFTVDKENPTGEITITRIGYMETSKWSELLNKLTFGIFNKNMINVSVAASDVTSLMKVEYYYQNFTSEAEAKIMSEDELNKQDGWEWTEVAENVAEINSKLRSVEPNEQFVVYVKLTDKAGRVTYRSSDGAITDNKEPNKPTIAVNEKSSKHGDFYVDDVYVDIQVAETPVGNVYSGLNKITYSIFAEDTKAEEHGILFSLDANDEISASLVNDKDSKPEIKTDVNNLVSNWAGQIKIDAEKFNSNKVGMKVTVIDNAGNVVNEELKPIMIDISAPVIEISYDNNNNHNNVYYNGDRTATITISERNLNTDDIKLVVVRERTVYESHGNGDFVDEHGYKITGVEWVKTWEKVEAAEGNGDTTTYTAEIEFNQDGDYEFYIECTDLAGWVCGNLKDTDYKTYEGNDSLVTFVEGTQNGTVFTIDKTAPDVTVFYDNNAAANEKYFNKTRTATVTIVEHNFSGHNNGYFTITTARGGETPNITWQSAGDVHTATISYVADGDYTFEVSVVDLAGNYSAPAAYGLSVAANDFVIDTTYENMITIGGVENGKAYGYDADVIPTLDIADINLEQYNITLTGIQKDSTIDLTDKVYELLNAGTENVTGSFDIFEVIQNLDGIYTLSVTAQDKAGNQDAEKVTFTVNRFGSVYVYNQYLLDLIVNGGSYVQSVTEDLVITEYNADKLLSDSLAIEITCDGKPLDNVIFDVTPEINDQVGVGESGWYQYKYTISKDNFATDGVYKISVSSKDATGNAPENNKYEGLSIIFRVDSTCAEISSIAGLEEPIINETEQEVRYTVYDTMGLKAVKVYVNGELVHDVTDFSEDMNNYANSFVLTEKNTAQTVRIVVEDLAGNITDTDADTFSSVYEFHKSVTVSTNIFVRWYANKPLFWGSIGGTTVLAAALWYFISSKRKKVMA